MKIRWFKTISSSCLALLCAMQLTTFAIASSSAEPMLERLTVPDSFDVQGHRGARSVFPENTLPAFLYALEIGVDTLELDLAVTSNGHVVIVHDQVVNPSICSSLWLSAEEAKQWVHELTLEQIKSFDCGTKRNADFPKQRPVPFTTIPTLAELFETVSGSEFENRSTVLFNIETKSNPENPQAQPAPRVFIERVLQVVEKYEVADRVTIQSFDHRTLVEAHSQAPQIKRSALFRAKPSNWLAAAEAAYADIVSPRGTLIDADSVAAMQAAGYLVIPWTANTPEQWRTLVQMGVDGIITDDPEPLLELIGRR